jgi:hypothetical protein
MDGHLVPASFQFKDPLLSEEVHIGRGTLARSSVLVCMDELWRRCSPRYGRLLAASL